MIALIAAVGKNGEIGKNNNLIWHLKEDMQYFKQTTLHHTVIMGYNTYKSIGSSLAHRKNIVITRNNKNNINDKDILVYDDIDKLIKDLNHNEEYFVIDSYFPFIKVNDWKKHLVKKGKEGNITYDFVIYERLNK